MVSPPDVCKVFLGFSILPLRFLHLIPLVSFSLPLEDFSRSPYLDLGPHSAGNRVRSGRLRVAPMESMDSSDSSLDLTAKVKNLKAIVAKRTSPVGGSRYPPIRPPSVIGAEEVAVWRKKYELPDDVVIRVPDPEDRVSDFGVDEVPVYEGYFASGFRGQIPSLVAKISETLGISLGQLNPPAWRTLIALQNLGDLYGLVIGVAEVLCSYSVSPLSSAEWRYYLHPRGKEPPVREIPKKERKRILAFEGNWTEKLAFMHLSGFSSIWQLEDLPRVDYSSGKDTIEQVLKLPLERRQIPFLVSKAALKHCSIWGKVRCQNPKVTRLWQSKRRLLRLSKYLHSHGLKSLGIGSTIIYTTTFVLGALKTPNITGTRSVSLSGTRGSGSCLEAGRNDSGVFFPNSLPLSSRFSHRSRRITSALKSTEVAHSQQAPLRQDPVPLVLLAWVPLKPELILNPGEDRFLCVRPEPSSSFSYLLEMMRLEL
ncbi:hypothetical protein F2Q69_00013616 [Brassica cretica]|uniref:Uncharacterized protein n=1 Tax=Brassica cretica TaxID=69181 RepID=A0A8S9QTH6_BRACR|nr:hypothetical protein F2Q69_00013616 [Brassica cretica]